MGTDVIPIDTLGATIRAHVAKGDASIEKAEQHYKAAGIHLIEAKARVAATPGLTWPAFLNSHCGIRRRRADDLIALADGRTTLAEMRDKNRERVAAHRERKKSELALRNAEQKASAPIEKPSEDVSEVDRLKATIAKLRKQLAGKEAQRAASESLERIAWKKVDEATNRAMFAEADKERLTEELEAARAEIARLMADIDAMTRPPDAGAAATFADFKRQWERMERAGQFAALDWMEKNVKRDSDDTLTDDQIPAFLKKDAA